MERNKKNDITALSDEDIKKIRRSAVIKLTISCIFIVIMIIFNTISWFSSSDNVEADDIGIKILSEKGYAVSCRAFKFDVNADKCIEILPEEEDLLLNEYDTIFTERNIYTGVFLRLELTGDFENISPKLMITRDRSNYDSSYIYLSDVVKFQTANEENCELDKYIMPDISQDFWPSALSHFLSAENSSSAVDFGDSSGNDIEISFQPVNRYRNVIWLFINYDDDLVNTKLAGSSVSLNEQILVEPDCSIIRLVTS